MQNFWRNSWTLDPGMSLVLLPCCQPSNVSTFSCKACEVRTAVPRPFGLVLSLRKWKARNGAKKRTLLGASTYQISLVLHFSHFTLLLAAFAIVFPRQSPLLNLSSVPCRSLIGEAHISAWEMTAEPFEPGGASQLIFLVRYSAAPKRTRYIRLLCYSFATALLCRNCAKHLQMLGCKAVVRLENEETRSWTTMWSVLQGESLFGNQSSILKVQTMGIMESLYEEVSWCHCQIEIDHLNIKNKRCE